MFRLEIRFILINCSMVLFLNFTFLSMIGLDVMNCEMLYSGNRNDASFFSRKNPVFCVYENVHFNVTLYLGNEHISYWKHHTILICNIFHYLTNHFASLKSTLQPFLISTNPTYLRKAERKTVSWFMFKFWKTRHVRKWSKSSKDMIHFEQIFFLS